MPCRPKHTVKVPTFNYTMQLNNNRCEKRRLEILCESIDYTAMLMNREYRNRQTIILRRFYSLCGQSLVENELKELEEKILNSCPPEVLAMDGILLNRTGHASVDHLPEISSTEVEKPKHVSSKQAPYSDLGKITAQGMLDVGEFTRPLYPWETVEGIGWLKSLGSSIGRSRDTQPKSPTITQNLYPSRRLSASRETPPNIINKFKCPHASNGEAKSTEIGKLSPLIDIKDVMASYNEQHRKLIIRNRFRSQMQEVSTRYNSLYMEKNLLARAQLASAKTNTPKMQ